MCIRDSHINERYEWKKTIGPLVDRPTHPSPWGYRSSDGMGLLEFLEWCEDLKMQPLLAVYGGYSMMQEFVKPGPDLDPYIEDALDEIEYVTGETSTKWGAEWQLHSEPLQTGTHVIESRRGSTSHQANPWFAIDRPQQTTEESGPVWFGALGWSGSWRITCLLYTSRCV